MPTSFRISPLFFFACLIGCAPAPPSPAPDLLLLNARVYTLDWPDPSLAGQASARAPVVNGQWTPDATAIAIRDGHIEFVGADAEASARYANAARTIDLNGATVLPGLVDTHTHFFELGASLERVQLRGIDTEDEAIAQVVQRARTTPKGEWIIGDGWDEGAWADRYPDKDKLSAAVPDHPVFMASLHSFAGWANQNALDVAGISADTPVPSGGEMRLGEDGQPNGLFLNNGVDLIEAAIPAATLAQLKRYAMNGLTQMARDGYVTVHDAGLSSAHMQALAELAAANALPIRVFAMLSARDEALMRRWIERGPDTDPNGFLVTRSVKAYYDGALGSRGARLLEDYSDLPGHRGVSGDEYGFDEALVAEAMRAGFQVGVHAIGDAGNREVLDFFEGVVTANPALRAGRHRIEHAQVLHPDDLPRLAALDVIASMEPPHAMEDKTWAEDRLGPSRIKGAYAWRSLRESGASITFNADNPGSDHRIFYGLHSAVARRDKTGQPVSGWYPDEGVTMEEAIRAYTSWSAFAGFRETQTGTIAVGKWADLTVMDIDPFALAPASIGDLLDGEISLTIVDGKVIYGR
ncbi:MAG: amidohydrolase [Gammaproteobacteria bacterium]